MGSACATAYRFVPSDSVPLLSIVKTGAHSSRGDLSLGFLPWEALVVRAVEGLLGGARPLVRIVNLLRVFSIIGTW